MARRRVPTAGACWLLLLLPMKRASAPTFWVDVQGADAPAVAVQFGGEMEVRLADFGPPIGNQLQFLFIAISALTRHGTGR